ncbi:hypothetical protein [Flocculibacter collagenilyticus]|uniref:hypothetical protein n=1 Tax=Flocculibacter collagenilyticus TaxID=2744479 RepID=UPI0018F5B0AD|nr:hypothetical protein [Flocculibacter collagenilyticus]
MDNENDLSENNFYINSVLLTKKSGELQSASLSSQSFHTFLDKLFSSALSGMEENGRIYSINSG